MILNKHKVREVILPDFQTYYEAVIIKAGGIGINRKQINRTEYSRNKPVLNWPFDF